MRAVVLLVKLLRVALLLIILLSRLLSPRSRIAFTALSTLRANQHAHNLSILVLNRRIAWLTLEHSVEEVLGVVSFHDFIKLLILSLGYDVSLR